MGTWGAGNFDNDAALDIVGDIEEVIDNEITGLLHSEAVCIDEGVEELMAYVALKNALVQLAAASPIDEETVAALRDKVLTIYDEQIDELDPRPGFKEERRRVIEQTFSDALALAKEV